MGFEAAPGDPLIMKFLTSSGEFLESKLAFLFFQFINNHFFAAGLAVGLVLISICLVSYFLVFYILPWWRALNRRSRALEELFEGVHTKDARQKTFAARYSFEIEQTFSGQNSSGISNFLNKKLFKKSEGALFTAWDEFREEFVDEAETPIASFKRADDFFLNLVEPPNFLGIAGTLLVSVGLLLTFIGIVAVLTSAGCSLGNEGNVCGLIMGGVDPSAEADENQRIEMVLGTIITGAASKFYTSIGGLAGSIILKFFFNIFTNLLINESKKLTDLLDQGLSYSSDESVNIKQLNELTEQSEQFRKFNTDLAVSIGKKFEAAVEPISKGLGEIHASLETTSASQLKVIREGVGAAVNEMAGGEISSLATVLGGLREELKGLSTKVADGGLEAANQLKSAGKSFEILSSDMDRKFRDITDNIKGAGGSFEEKILSVTEGLRGSIEGSATKLSEAGDSNAKVLKSAAERLDNLGRTLAEEAQEGLRSALSAAADETRRTAKDAAGSISLAVEGAAEKWGDSINTVVERLEALNTSIEKSADSVGAHNAALVKTTEATEGHAGVISQAADTLSGVVTPLLHSAEALQKAGEKVESGLTGFSEPLNDVRSEVKMLSQSIKKTQESASEAWASYSDKFGKVDESLAKALVEINTAISSNQSRLKEFVGDIDKELAAAVTQLAGIADPIKDAADIIEEVVRDLAELKSKEKTDG